jgi:cell division protein FtsW
MSRKLESDKILFGTVVALVLFGCLMVYSASAVMAAQQYGSSYYFLLRQVGAATLGLIAMAGFMSTDYRRLRRPLVILPALALQLVLLVVVLFADRSHSAHRWLHLGAASFEPSEFSKIVLVVFLAYFLSEKRHPVDDLRHTLLPVVLVTGASVLLVLKEPDLGTSLAILFVVAAMLFAARLPAAYFAAPALAAIPAFYLLVYRVPYRWARVVAFLNPDVDPLGKGFQIIQSTIAVATGGIDGVGFMEGKQKLFFLPEPHNDFIFAVICEELGFIGAIALLVLFGVILWRGLRAASRSSDEFGRLLAVGLTVLLVGQALVNVSVVVGLLPTKGIPLPFISYGGSSLVMNLIAVGILLNISQRTG